MYTYNKTLMVENISIYYYHVEDIKEYIKENLIKEKTDYDQLNKIYEENKNSKKVNEELAGIAKGKNIMKTSGRIYILH